MRKSRVTSIALTLEQREIIQTIADERYGGNIGLVIRTALKEQYPTFAKAETVSKKGWPGRKTERTLG